MFKTTVIVLVLLQIVLADRLKVDIYFEALCPDSQDLVKQQLFPFYTKETEIRALLDINLIPFGKASYKLNENGTLEFTCQHRENECLANMYLACSLKMYTLDQSMKYTHCIMSQSDAHNHLERCANELSLSYSDLKTCQEDKKRGPQYLKELGDKTGKLKFVPTVRVNNVPWQFKHVREYMGDFKKYICSRFVYKPKSCEA